MARKFCPACNQLVGGSATACSKCGHAFDASTIVVERPPKLCWLCGASNPHHAETCRCGQHFDMDPDEARMVLRSRRTNAWIITGLGAVGIAGIGVLFFAIGVVSPWSVILATAVFAYGLRGMFATHQLLAALPPPLPKATLRSRD